MAVCKGEPPLWDGDSRTAGPRGTTHGGGRLQTLLCRLFWALGLLISQPGKTQTISHTNTLRPMLIPEQEKINMTANKIWGVIQHLCFSVCVMCWWVFLLTHVSDEPLQEHSCSIWKLASLSLTPSLESTGAKAERGLYRFAAPHFEEKWGLCKEYHFQPVVGCLTFEFAMSWLSAQREDVEERKHTNLRRDILAGVVLGQPYQQLLLKFLMENTKRSCLSVKQIRCQLISCCWTLFTAIPVI